MEVVTNLKLQSNISNLVLAAFLPDHGSTLSYDSTTWAIGYNPPFPMIPPFPIIEPASAFDARNLRYVVSIPSWTKNEMLLKHKDCETQVSIMFYFKFIQI